MADFPRDVQPVSFSPPRWPGPVISIGQSGKGQSRSGQRAGRTWVEVYPGLDVTDRFVRAWLAKLNELWMNGTPFDIVHPQFKVNNGVGGGSPVIDGANQTGSSILVRGVPASLANWLRGGDIIKLPGVMANLVFDVTADVSTGVGTAKAITSSSVANPTVITMAAAHGWTTGDQITIAGHSGSTPSLNGTHTITVVNTTQFTIPVNVTVGGTGGTATRLTDATIPISPSIYTTASSPTNAGAVTISSAKFRAILADEPNTPEIEESEEPVAVMVGIRLAFREWW